MNQEITTIPLYSGDSKFWIPFKLKIKDNICVLESEFDPRQYIIPLDILFNGLYSFITVGSSITVYKKLPDQDTLQEVTLVSQLKKWHKDDFSGTIAELAGVVANSAYLQISEEPTSPQPVKS